MQTITSFNILLRACQEGKLEEVRALIGGGVSPHAKNSSGQSVIDIFTGLTEGSSEEKLNNALIINANEGNAEKVKLLLALGGDVNQIKSGGFTLLHIASFKGHLEVVKELIEAEHNLGAKSSDGATPLYYACQNGHLEIVNALIEAGADLNAKTPQNFTSLFIACGKGHLEIVKALIGARANIDAKSSDGATPLYYACQNGHLEVVKELIKKSANLTAETKYQFTPLHVACRDGHLEVVKELIGAGADPHAKNNSGQSVSDIFTEALNIDHSWPSQKKLNYALMHNVILGDVGKIKLLLTLGADTNYVDPDEPQFTAPPLGMACGKNNLEAVKLLIEAGAEVNNSVIDIVTFQETEIKDGEDRLKASLIINSNKGNAEKVKLLLALRCDVNQEFSSGGGTLLHIASSQGHLEVVKTLIEAGADVNARHQITVKFCVINSGPEESSTQKPTALAFYPGTQPLHLACQNGHLQVVKELIKAGADPQAEAEYKRTPLHLACQNGHLQVVKELIEAGANPQAEAEYKLTPLHLACQNGHLEVVKELIKAGADPQAEDQYEITPFSIAIEQRNSEITSELTQGYLNRVNTASSANSRPNSNGIELSPSSRVASDGRHLNTLPSQ